MDAQRALEGGIPTMKAIVCEKFGPADVLELQEIDQPTPKANEVLVRNYASSMNTTDIIFRSGRLPDVIAWSFRQVITPLFRMAEVGIRKPRRKVIGTSFSGGIVAVGPAVTGWEEGDHVYGYSLGACAEYMAVPASRLARKPANMSFQEAGAVPGAGTVAIEALRDWGQLQSGQNVLILGASGGIGTFAVQVAKIYGAEVTGVCGPSNLKLVQELGADAVIDYTTEDFTKTGQTWDLIFDIRAKHNFSKGKNSLTKKGTYVSNNVFSSKKHFFHLITSKFTSKKLKFGECSESVGDLNILREWMEAGKLKPVIDKVYPLSETAEAHRHYETGHSKGRVVISID
jgi:NADPH:quinone reductase-like Zn-dependent oxidoreductase